MTQTSAGDRTAARTKRVSAWTGWVAFGGVMLILLGLFHAVQGVVAVYDRGYYLVRPSGLVVAVDYSVWGWVHIGLGVVAVLAGIGVLTGNAAARVAAIVIAGVSAVVNLGFVAAYPVWSMVVIALDVIVIYAIVAHGRDLRLIR
ncbi:hypothetical protein LWP59_18035 [Amycolatopsis acidiphila]|uniref:DUF7144 domain-containing protein n=1 Tax=Amycolatopsis acidiphila TaxID=715473 RepID=A0A558ANS7_9PSEU|nr:hypothetical protein [Amycolatopsis acidiphila]TVT25900.1 hypothetical protein FNH06_00195 [Amycolatopsis acidiphila]UIJ63399.1 hypothetical protein LWP59_18035 [Amycolatopsis acidiphila]GHG75402.1 membrane protein [Amycolatopsis acidiphila]